MVDPIFWWWESAISPEMCDLIIQETHWEKEEEAKVVRKDGDKLMEDKRKTKVVFEEINSVPACILHSHILMANIQAKWRFQLAYLQKVQIGKYEDKGHYDWHVDTMMPDEEGMQRKLSAILFLSDPQDYEGGQFEIKNCEKDLGNLPKGSILVFPSYIKHRVTPVTSGTRYSVAAWMMGPTFK